MATWKELGEVPDSEDDEDLESLSYDSPEQDPVNDLRSNEDIPPNDPISLTASGSLPAQEAVKQDDIVEKSIEEGGLGETIRDLDRPASVLSTQEAEATSPLEVEDGNKEDDTLEETFEEGEKEIVDELELPQAFLPTLNAGSASSPQPGIPSSPLVSLQILDLPSSWTNLLDEDGSGSEEEPSHGNLDVPAHEEPPQPEEISKCYVEITSAAVNQPSASLASSSNLLEHRLSAEEPITNSNKRKALVDDEEEVATGFRKRNFRERTGKQLHPYRHEQMTYDRSLRERGIKPIKIVETEERRLASPPSESQLLDSQNLDSQDGFVVMEESQETDHIVERPSPARRQTPLQSQDLDEAINHAASIDSDDDLPPVENLIQKPNTKTPFAKRHSKTYSTKGKPQRPPPQLVRPAPQISSPQSARPSSVFDIQTSPLVTSSPLPNYNRGQISRTTSASSGLPTPKHRPNAQHPDPTQRLNKVAMKPLSAPIFVDSDADTDAEEVHARRASPDPTDLDEQSDAQSSSDESIELRRVGKRIRGVLPASHLRLDSKNKKQATSAQTRQASRSVSPVETPLRRGVALPTIRRSTQGAPTPSNADMAFLDGLSDDDEDDPPDMITQTQRTGLSSLFAQSRVGDAEEEDTIDLMLPSQKRRRTTLSGPKKKRKIVHTGHGQQGGLKRQPRITEHMDNPRTSKPVPRKRATQKRRKSSKEKTPPPRLSLLDVTDTLVDRTLPLFIRVAARTSRARDGQGRQSPTKKFIRLANREDTADATSVLQEWRNGTIRPNDLGTVHRGPDHTPGLRTGPFDDSVQKTSRYPPKRVQPQAARRLGMSRKLVISSRDQQSMNGYVVPQEAHYSLYNPLQQQAEPMNPNQSEKRRTDEGARSRPAQLESLELTRSDMHSVPRFRYVKGTLDLSYRIARKRALLQANVPLNRFIADENLPRADGAAFDALNIDMPLQSKESIPKITQRTKRLPRRLDVGAAEYRQPNAPLVLDFLAPVTIRDEGVSTKLHNLGKYGTNYPTSFDIFPLPSGVFFQDTTFIGSGLLADNLKDVGQEWCRPAFHGPPTVLSLGAKDFYWGSWNDQVSSEVGICFDWISEQHSGQTSDSLRPATAKTVDVLQIVCVYVRSVSFVDASSLHEFVSRMRGVLDDFLCRLTKEALLEHMDQATNVGLLMSCILLCLRLLLMSRSTPELSSSIFGLEALLQRFAAAGVKVLLAIGLEKTRKLYDNLQYISIRDRGIGSDDFETEAWVVILKVLTKAGIPRGSFMDVVNSALLRPDVKTTQDARTMEKMWYILFSLLPLSEFDDYGFVIQGSRHAAAFDNWVLPQQMLKRVFDLYRSDQRQSPSFNDYCRSIVSRCHCLMVVWGWWKCNGVIGTLFDFFASQNLAHLRNEEVHESPRFLQELHLNPSFETEPEDRCFHIFLKIVALGVMHCSEVNNGKGGRSLVARLLPNHDRQYPKEEEILERDLASLRNHHDLLCTLYFSTPPQQRFSPTLIQSLVDSSNAHKQAVIISLRAWERLTLFVLSDDPDNDNILPLALWHRSILQNLSTQYANTEIEIRSQAAASSATYTEGNILDTVRKNQMATMSALGLAFELSLGALASNPNLSLATARQFADLDTLSGFLKSKPPPGPESLTLLKIVQKYTKVLLKSVEGANVNDSQELMILCLEQSQAAAELGTKILDPLADHIRTAIQSFTLDTSNLSVNQREEYMKCWADVVLVFKTFVIKGFELSDLIGRGKYAVLNHHQSMSDEESHLWLAFLVRLLDRSCPWKELTNEHVDITTELLKVSMRSPSQRQNDDTQTLAHALFRQNWYIMNRMCRDGLYNFNDIWIRYSRPGDFLERIFEAMRTTIVNNLPTSGCDLDGREKTSLFSDQICNALASVELQLKVMSSNDQKAHHAYVEHVQKIVSVVRVHAHGIVHPIPNFFSVASKHYWPPVKDPDTFVDMVQVYMSNWKTIGGEQSVRRAIHFLLSSFDKVIKTNKLMEHVEHLQKLMSGDPHFFSFVLMLAMPLYDISIRSESGWVLLGVYYPLLATEMGVRFRQGKYNGLNVWLAEIIRFTKSLVESNSGAFEDPKTRVLSAKWDRIIAILLTFWQTISTGIAHRDGTPTGFERYTVFFDSLQWLAPEFNKCEKCDFSVILFPEIFLTPKNRPHYAALTTDLNSHVRGWSAPPSGSYIKLVDLNTSPMVKVHSPYLWEVMKGKQMTVTRVVDDANAVVKNAVNAIVPCLTTPKKGGGGGGGGGGSARRTGGYENGDGGPSRLQ